LYKSAPHLNDKHTVFGKVVGGKDLLKQLALVETDDEDKPKVKQNSKLKPEFTLPKSSSSLPFPIPFSYVSLPYSRKT
jgi:hypothetical protein